MAVEMRNTAFFKDVQNGHAIHPPNPNALGRVFPQPTRRSEARTKLGERHLPACRGRVGVMIGVFNIRLGSEERHMRADRTTALPPPQWKLVWMYRVIL